MKVRSLGSITSCGTFWMFQSKIPIEVHAVGSLQSPLLLGQPGEWRLREHLHATKEGSWYVHLCYLLKSVQSAHSYLSTKRCFSSHIVYFIRLLLKLRQRFYGRRLHHGPKIIIPQTCLETSKSSQMDKDNYPSLKPNIAPQNGWLEHLGFLLGFLAHFQGRTVTAPPATSPNQWNIHSLSWSSASECQPDMLRSWNLSRFWEVPRICSTFGCSWCSKQNCWAPCVFHSFLHPIHLLFRRGVHKNTTAFF